MFRLSRLFPVLLGLAATSALAQPSTPSLLPRPVSARTGQGYLMLQPGATIALPGGDRGAALAAERLVDLLQRTGGLALNIAPGATSASIRFERVAGMEAEAYRLKVTPQGAVISASGDAGLFYGGISLWQLVTSDALPRIGAVDIEDRPRFGWRGLMLDSARHFQSPAFIRSLIDWMAASKLNRLHWHLVDDQGWRIEIRKYPKLTDVSAWRSPATAAGAPPLPRIGGYYTQDEIRAIVAYAAERQIEIVPEIEMPGHALAAIKAYPELGMGVPAPAGVEADWGVFPWLYNVEPSTLRFLTDVLDEVMELFPSKFIHIGGDEAVKDQWKADPRIQAKIKSLGLANEDALQGWLVKQMDAHITARGRRLIGWDEILDGGVERSAAIMSWRGLDGAIKAAKGGHDTVLSPAPILYFDNFQSETGEGQPGRGNLITLAKVYAFEPAPATLTAEQQRHILGLQGNLWAEHMRTEERVAYMAFPRALAIAELGWSPAGHRDFRAFAGRAAVQLARLEKIGLQASPAAFVPVAAARLEREAKAKVSLTTQVGAEIHYTVDGTEPNAASPRYRTPLSLNLPTRLRARAFAGARPLPGSFDRLFDVEGLRRRADFELKTCSGGLTLALEDDFPAAGPRALFMTDISHPCWIYEKAEMDGIESIAVDVGQLPFNFQIGEDKAKIRFAPPRSAAGEIEVRAGGCTGQPIAVLPLEPAAGNPGVTTLRAPIRPMRGRKDLCFTYTARGPDLLWAIDSVQLVARP